MAIWPDALKMIAPHIADASVLSLGYPDILVRAEDITKLLGVTPTRFTQYGKWHGVEHDLAETAELFELLGSRLDCIDIHASRGCERIVDLNEEHDLGKFDLVIDAGTIEHCFNIGQAIKNAANAVKVGGYIFHSPPMTMLNHGFYNICPTMLYDFYTQNGWRIERMEGWNLKGSVKISWKWRFQGAPETSLYFLAQRVEDKPLCWPMQSKYLKNPELKVA